MTLPTAGSPTASLRDPSSGETQCRPTQGVGVGGVTKVPVLCTEPGWLVGVRGGLRWTPAPGTPPRAHPELGPGLLDGLGRGVQRPPLVGELGPAALPLLQEEGGPDDVEDGEDHAADILAGLRDGWHQLHRSRSPPVPNTPQQPWGAAWCCPGPATAGWDPPSSAPITALKHHRESPERGGRETPARPPNVGIYPISQPLSPGRSR